MRKITVFLLLLVFAWSGMVSAQNAPMTEQQKVAFDQAARQSEAQVQPVYVQEVPVTTSTNDNVLTIGTGTTNLTSYMNWSNFWENNRTQTLYLASELAGPKFINQLAWQFTQVAPSGSNWVNNVVIKIKPTAATSLTSGAYADMSGAVTVYSSSAQYVPATATGWAAPIDITDYAYNGTDNLIIEVVWGDLGYWASTYFKTAQTAGAVTRTLYGYADSETPPNYGAAVTSYSNIAVYWTPFNPPGNLTGHVFDSDGVAIANATVGVVDGANVATDATGYYYIADIFGGDQDIYAMKDGWNEIEAIVVIPSGGTLTHDFTLTKPSLTISPLMFDETLNPNEYLTKMLGMLNIGDGPAGWTAEIVYPETFVQNDASDAMDFTQMTESSSSFGDNSHLSFKMDENAERGLLDCPDGSVFGNPPVSSDNGYTSDAGVGYFCYQQFSTTGNFNTVTFWSVVTSLPNDPRDFTIEVREAGATPGAIVSSSTVTLNYVNTGSTVLGFPLLQYTATIPATSITDGWIGVQAAAGSATNYWCNTYSGSGAAVQAMGGSYTTLFEKLAVCLSQVGGGGGVSDWLSLGQYEGSVGPNGTSFNLPVNFDATGTEAGQVYNAEIHITTDPNVGTFTVPVTMTIYGDPLSPVTDLTATLTDQVAGTVALSWTFTRPVNFQYFLIKRNGLGIGTTTSTTFTNILPTFGNYCYTVTPVYDAGNGVPGGPACVDWFIPALCWSPATVENSQWPDVTEQVTMTLSNCGDGTLAYEFPDYTAAERFACSNEIELRDSFGDGWNGGAISVFVNGTAVLTNITLPSGSGPSYFSFPVNGGDLITTDFVPGSWASECNYKLLDVDRNAYFTSNPAADLLPSANILAPCPVPSYITSVQPAAGTIASGENVQITLTYNSDGFYAGNFPEGLALNTNDPDNLEAVIPNIMHVYTPASISGTVTDCVTGAPKKNVTVTAYGASTYAAETRENGTYTMIVDAGTYDVEFSMVGFHTYTVEDVVVTVAGSPVDVDATLCEMAYAPSFVYADPNEADTQALITWGIPMGPYQIQYDDGSAESFFSFLPYGSATAVKFTPAGYPATVTGGRLFVGDGSWPEGVNFLGTEVSVGVIAADGANGMPGTVLDSTTITVDNYGWVNFDNALYATVNSGNFYIAVWKLLVQVPVGVDQNVPTYYRSYVKPAGGNWAASSYQDFMIRAIVSGPGTNVAARTAGEMIYPAKPNMTDFVATSAPNGRPGIEGAGMYLPIEGGATSRELVDYGVARINNFNPEIGETPEDGDLNVIAGHNGTQSYNDAGFGGQPAGFYAYAVRAQYSMENSEWIYSNVVAHGLDNVVTLNVSQCDGGDVAGANVSLISNNYPYQHLYAVTDASGVVVFDSVINGTYDLLVTKMAYQNYEHNGIMINYDYTEDVVLANKTYPAKNLFVEPLTSVATWEAPIYTAVELQNFEDAVFPPVGWVIESNSRGFFRTNAGGSSFWPIPAGDGYYACANDDGFNGDASVDRLILPVCDLREGATYNFAFDYFYDGSWGGSAYVEYSLDNGANWTVLQSLNAVGDWTTQSVSLASFAGEDALTLCFHYDDNGMWADGIAVDNVSVSNGAVDILGYEISLNNGYITEVGPEVLTYQYQNLTYGQTYTATVKAKFPCGLSEPVNYVFQSTFLYPPMNLGDAYVYNTNEIPLMWNPPVTVPGPASAVMAEIRENNQAIATRSNTDLSSVESNGGSPEATRETVLNWDGDNADSLGLTAGGDWEVMAYFPASIVDPLSGEGITAVEVFIGDLSSSFSLKFYDAGSPTLPGAVLYEQAFTPVDGWNTITLDEPVMLSGADVWVGYSIFGQPAGTYPAGMDGGPAVLGFGDWVLLNGAWDNVGNYGFGNFNIRAHVNPVSGGGGVPDGLVSFNVYQDGELLANVPYAGQDPDEFVNYVINPIDPGTYS
ncbi:MAG: carboxypeptidase regulatory-like domain-containing protein, partial [Bacteroidales bacterium]